MWVTAWSLESQPFNSWESTTDLQDLQDFLFLFLRLFVCIRKSFQVDTRDAILSLNEAPVLFVSWGFEGDVIQRVNRIFTADDNVLAGGALKKVKKSFVASKKTPVFFLIFKVIGAQQGGQNFPKSWNAQKATFFFGVPVDPTHLLGRNLHLECADHKSKKRENSFGFLESLGFVDLNIETGNVSRPLGALMIFFWGIRAKFPEQCPFHQTWFWIFKTYTAHNFKLPTFETSWQESSTQVLRLPNSLTPVTCQLLQCRLFLGFPASLHVGLWKRMVLWCHCANSSAIKLIFEKCSTDWLRGRFSCREFRGSPGNSAILL